MKAATETRKREKDESYDSEAAIRDEASRSAGESLMSHRAISIDSRLEKSLVGIRRGRSFHNNVFHLCVSWH